jgi:3-phenylpropionate/cinnamic acid dioxygenase small subunit
MNEYQNDYREIQAVLNRYASALDKKQYQRLSEVFTREGTANYIGLAECKGLDSIIDLVSGVLDRCGQTQHLLGNVQIDVQGDQATASCYLQAIHVGLGDFAGQVNTVWGEYRDQLVKTAAGWRISYRELNVLHSQGDIGLA